VVAVGGRQRAGSRIAGFIYGTIVVLSVIVAGSRAYPHGPGHIAVLVAVTCVVFWLAHVYAHALGHSVDTGEHLSRRELVGIARREGSLVESALVPCVILILGAIGLVSDSVAVWGSFVAGLVALAAQGLYFARAERFGPLATLAVVAFNLGLGVILVALKLLLSH
jgi:hypothetical protein